MRKSILILIIAIFSFSGELYSQSIEYDCASLDSIILWNQENLLTWLDYRGSPDTTKESLDFADAVSHIGFYFDFYEDAKQNIQFISLPYFNRNSSWVKADSSIQLLNHERTHFNIAEVFVRQARKRISELKEKGIDDTEIYYKNLRTLKNEYDSINIAYDNETMYGSFDRFQIEWENKIEKELELLNDYAVDYYNKYFKACTSHTRDCRTHKKQ